MMMSDGLELCVDDGRVNHSWCMGVISHGYGGLGGGRVGGGDRQACGTKTEAVGRLSAEDGVIPDFKVKILMMPDHTPSRCAAEDRTGSELADLPGRP